MRRWGRRGGEGRRPAAEGDWSGAVVCAGAERARAGPLWGPQRVPRSGAGCSGLTMEGARRRREAGRDRGPGVGRAGEGQAGDAGGGGEGRGLLHGERGAAGGCESPAGAEEGSGPGTPLWFPFRGARCGRALSFPGEMAAPPPLAWAVPGSRFARERIVIIIGGGEE